MTHVWAMEHLGIPRPRRVVVLRALRLGDMLCAVPALRALRAALPRAEIVLIGLPWARAFAARFHRYLDGFREFPGYPGLPERAPQVDRIPGFFAAIRAERFDLAIQMHGSGPIVNTMVERFGARHSAGFYLPGDGCPDPVRYRPWPDSGLELRRLLALMDFLGVTSRGEHLEFPIRDEDERALAAIEGAKDLRPGGYVCVHPGASVAERRWPPERFAAVADFLASRGLRVVLTGTAGESALTRRVAAAMRSPCLDLAGRTDLGALAVLVRGSRLLLSNDTGVAHLADALRVPSVIISTGDNPARWAPIDDRLHRVLCRDAGVEAEKVRAVAADLLRNGPIRAA
jgi:ADP-heptose:LPS heptosyltransferase